MSTRQIVMSDVVAPPGPPYSHAVKVGNLVFVSGCTPYTRDRQLAPDFEGQFRQVMENIRAILATAGTTLDKVCKVNVILTDIDDFAKMNALYREYFREGNYPARTTIEAKLAGKGFFLEIECVAEA